MEEILLNADFIDFIISQMEKGSATLMQIKEYKKYNKKYSKINEIVDKLDDKNNKALINSIINCFENMSVYENAYAFYLGMKETFNMTQLEQV